jgi:hypothetical protein
MKSIGMEVAPSATSVFLLSKSNCASSPIVSAKGERAIFVPDFRTGGARAERSEHQGSCGCCGNQFLGRHRGSPVRWSCATMGRQFAAAAVDRDQSRIIRPSGHKRESIQ